MGDGKDSARDRKDYVDRDERFAKRMAATVYRQNEDGIPVIIGNSSLYGVYVESEVKVEIGEAIRLSVDGLGDFEGVVRWIRPNQFGVHTIDTINISLLDDQN